MALFGTGPAKALDKYAIAREAQRHGWHPAALEAIATAESGGFGWFPDGRMKKLPEPHWYLRLLPKDKQREAVKRGLATTRSFKSTKRSGHYRRMKGASSRYRLFDKWRKFDEEAAFGACSWGTYQIMGFNHKLCGYSSAKAMVLDFLNGEPEQLRAFVSFLLKKGLKTAIRKLDFRKVARVYNGSGQVDFYAGVISRWFKKLSRGKWKDWDPKEEIPPEPTPAESKPAKDPHDAKAQGGAGGVILTAPGAAAAAGYPWEYIAAAFAGGLAAGILGWVLYQWLKDRADPEKTRIAQPDDELEEPA